MINNFTSKLILLLACMAWAGTSVWAQADDGNLFIVDGIYYKQITEWGQYVYVMENPLKYKGDIVVPDWVTYDGTRYKVLGIGDSSFKDCTELTSISFEGEMGFIGNYAFENCTGLQDFTCPTAYYWYGSGNQIGYRAFYGCHFKTFTITNTSAPGYDTKNPSYTGGISNTRPNWFENEWKDGYYYVYLSQYTTLYVPAGCGLDYMEESSYADLQQWQSYHFSKIKEWGTEEWDNAMEFMYDTIPGYWQAFDMLQIEVRQMTLYTMDFLYGYVDSLARAEGIEPDFTPVQNAFKWGDYSHRGAESFIVPIIPSIKPTIDRIYNLLILAEENCRKLNDLRREYYDIKREYEREYESEYQRYMDEYNSIDWENLSDEELAQRKEVFDYWKENLARDQENIQEDLAQRREGLSNMDEEAGTAAYQAANILDDIPYLGKETQDFINEFKTEFADGIHPVHDDVNTTVSSCYSLSGERLSAPQKGMNIIRMSDGTSKKVLIK